jgi:RNA polymerase sigma-70 factor (ECF subfamily)
LIASSSIAEPRADALVALLVFQAARLTTRTDEAGDLVLLDAQDRGQWDQHLTALGFHHFERSIRGNIVSTYHVQAAIAATHARANSGESTDWNMILELYDQLMEVAPSPVVALNRAVAVGKVYGAEPALAAIEALEQDPQLQDYYLFCAVRGHLLLELGRSAEAAACYRAALERRCSEPERRFLKRKLAECAGRGALRTG